MPPRDKAANAELAVRAKAAEREYILPRMWASTSRRPRPQSRRRLIGKAEVIARVGVTYQTIWKLMSEGRFPRSVAFADKAMWFEDEIDQFVNSLPRRVLKGDRRMAATRVVAHVARARARNHRTERSPA